MNATVRDLDGGEAGDVDLPDVFSTQYRPDLIQQAVTVAQANRKQDYGADPRAGMRTTAESFGSGRGMAHVPRSQVPNAGSVGRRVPQTVKGRRAHPPKAEKSTTRNANWPSGRRWRRRPTPTWSQNAATNSTRKLNCR
jgi:large subunit ribosomal protein L4e